ncbi:MAG: FkbM family methyltransferase [Pseudomonadota bacterium]
MTPPEPLKPWMRKRIREAATEPSEIEVLAALVRTAREHDAFVDTEFEMGDTIVTRQKGRTVHFPRPLHKENHRTILRGYLEGLHGKYQIEGFCEVAEGDVVVDCGAYVGGFARSVVEIASRVVLIEPAPANYECCLSNLKGFDTAEVHQMGLFNTTGTLPLQLSNRCVDHSLLAPDRGATGESVEVPIMRLEDLAAKLDLNHIDFLKLEAEGAEIEVIDGMGAMRPSKISIDAGPERYGESPMEELQEMLRTRGYEVQARGNTLCAVTA